MFLENLEMLMKERGLNKHSFSQQSGIPYKTIDNFWKKGCNNIKLTTLKKISSFFGVTLDFLIFGNKRSENNIDISDHEKELIAAYRSHPTMQPAINKMLDIQNEQSNSIKEDIANELKQEALITTNIK